MIGLLFTLGSELIEVRIDGINIYFRNTSTQGRFATIDGLKLNKYGVIKEFPDLKDKDDWKEITVQRFKRKIKNMNSEDERANYVLKDLKKHGYKPYAKQRKGHRVRKL